MELADLELAFSTEPLVGWRLWRVTREVDRRRSALELATALLAAEERGDERPVARVFERRLRSLTQFDVWPAARRLDAGCDVAVHETTAPLADCVCGVWGFRTFAQAHAALADYADGSSAIALGRVWLWGRIIEHAGGYRAQHGYPRDLTLHGGDEAAALELAERYRVPVSTRPWPARRLVA